MRLLERAPILAEMRGLLQEASQGTGRLLVVAGEAGSGKSVVVRQFGEEQRSGIHWLAGACDALATPRALGPLLDVAHADPAIDRLLSANASQEAMFRSLLGLLSRGTRPTVFVVEDVHWADEATLDLLLFIGRRVETTRALVVVTHRQEEVGPQHPVTRLLGNLATVPSTRRLTLPPLSAQAVAELAADSDLDPRELHARTHGNPFFVTEVLAAGGGVPASVRDAVLARALRLPAAARSVLDVAAVIGSPIDPQLLREASEGAMDDIERCLTSGMLVAPEQTLSFRHELAREDIFTTMSLVRRVEIHGHILAAMESAANGTHDPARLAFHAAGAMNGDAVLAHAPVAARRAARFGAHREAAAHFASALRFASLLPVRERANLLEAYAHECFVTAQIERAIAARREAVLLWSDVGEANDIGANHCHLAILDWAACDIDQANIDVEAAIALLSSLPPGPELAMTYATLARIRTTTAGFAEAILWGERAIAIAEAVGTTDTLIGALITVGVTRLINGDDLGRAELERALELALTANRPADATRAYTNIGVGYGKQYRFAEAEPFLRTAITYAAEHDVDHGRLYATAWLAYTRLVLGDWDEAAYLAESVLRAPAVSQIARIVALRALAIVRVRQGAADAMPLLDEALPLAQGTGSPMRLGSVHTARAEVSWMMGDREATGREARIVFDLSVATNQCWYVGEFAYWRWKIGDHFEIPAIVPQPYRLQIAGDADGAARAWDALGCPFEAARARADSSDEASRLQALTAFERLGAWANAANLRREMRASGAEALPRGPIKSTSAHPARLTKRQAEILRLMAAGQTNAEIASHLFLSRRTIENHVAAIFGKLNVGDRNAATAAAIDRGLADSV